MVIPPRSEPEATPAAWAHAVEAHLRILRATQAPAILEVLSRRAGIPVDAGGNGAASYADVLRYLRAVQDVMGHAAWLSAKLLITHRMQEAGLTAELPHAARNWSGVGRTPRGGPGDR